MAREEPMGFLNKLFGKDRGAGTPDGVDSAVSRLTSLYDDPEAKSERGLSISGPRADEVRKLGRQVYKAGGKEDMLAVREGLRAQYAWAVPNLEAIWSSLPEWRS
ncbi:MAG: hypothetical protein JO023_10915 [Chloroflexi bacterium]|nr:hypothetical protein [Chloroflexota bacterium]